MTDLTVHPSQSSVEPTSRHLEQSRKQGRNNAADHPEEPARFSQMQPAPTLSPTVTFEVDDTSGDTFVRVIDRESGEVIREIPPEELRRLAQEMWQFIGTLVNTSA